MRVKEIIRDDWNTSSEDDLLFEMSNLAPDETGLPFTVFVSPGMGLPHGPRVKVTMPPWGAHPEGVYTIDTIERVAGTDWLSLDQKAQLKQWIDLNKKTIEDFWYSRIHYDRELRARIIPLGNAPPGNSREAVVALRASAPKVQAIHWHDGAYYLTFQRFTPSAEKLHARFAGLGFAQPVIVGTIEPPNGTELWRVPQPEQPQPAQQSRRRRVA